MHKTIENHSKDANCKTNRNRTRPHIINHTTKNLQRDHADAPPIR
ncbi:hypothetical protein HL670_01837 [Serratia plymuthica]|nr:hypothetical protein HL670_01837 [Serratia plymuthica]